MLLVTDMSSAKNVKLSNHHCIPDLSSKIKETIRKYLSNRRKLIVARGFITFITGINRILTIWPQSHISTNTYKCRVQTRMSIDAKNGLRGFRPGPTQTGLCSHRNRLEA